MKNQIGPERVRRESPEAETLCARSPALEQRFHQNFGFRGVEKRVKTVIFRNSPKTLRGGFFHIILCLRGSLQSVSFVFFLVPGRLAVQIQRGGRKPR